MAAFIPDEDLVPKVLLHHSDNTATHIVPWWRVERGKDGRLVRHFTDLKSEVLSYQQVLDQAAACSKWYEAEIFFRNDYDYGDIPFYHGHAADFEVARSCLLEYLDSIQSHLRKFFAEIDKQIFQKQKCFDMQRRKELLHLVRIAFYNTLVMLLWTLSFQILAKHLHLAIAPVIYALLHLVAHDVLGASWGILFSTTRTLVSRNSSPVRREFTAAEKELDDARQEWNVFKKSTFRRWTKMWAMVHDGALTKRLDDEMEYFGFQSSVWAYLPPKLSELLFEDEPRTRFLDSVDFDW